MSKKVESCYHATDVIEQGGGPLTRLQPTQMPTSVHALTCDPADFMVREVAGDPGHMCSQTVAQQVDPFPGQIQLVLRGRARMRWSRGTS